jgi:SAM-dependent methyltransferase
MTTTLAHSTFDGIAESILDGEVRSGIETLVRRLDDEITRPESWPSVLQGLRGHRLHDLLLQDPFTSHSWRKPRGYAGDAALIDIIYDQQPAPTTTALGRAILPVSTNYGVAKAVRERREFSRRMLMDAMEKGQSVCALACGHWREADGLESAGGPSANRIVVVDQDPLSLDRVRLRHGASVACETANVIRFLRRAAAHGSRFDLIYSLGLTDYFDDALLGLFIRLAKSCLAPEGRLLVANFVPDHPARGYMDACMDWRLLLRDEHSLSAMADAFGLNHRGWRDATGLIAYCEMTNAVG